jgi:hypothetical protein
MRGVSQKEAATSGFCLPGDLRWVSGPQPGRRRLPKIKTTSKRHNVKGGKVAGKMRKAAPLLELDQMSRRKSESVTRRDGRISGQMNRGDHDLLNKKMLQALPPLPLGFLVLAAFQPKAISSSCVTAARNCRRIFFRLSEV